MTRLRSWLRATMHRSQTEHDMDIELRLHIERYAEDLVAKGLSSEEAHRRAHAEFGSIEARKDECREALGLRWLDEFLSDLRYAVRMLRRSPTFTTIAILSLALGIGANTAIFSLMEAALWKTLPVKNPDQLRLLTWTSGPKSVMNYIWGNCKSIPSGGQTCDSFSYPVFLALQRQNTAFQSLFAFRPVERITAVIDGSAELVIADLVSGNLFESIGVSTVAGRPILAADDVRSSEGAVAVISDGFWARRFGRDPSVLGKQIQLNQLPVTIVGINRPDFTGVRAGDDPDVFVPLSMQPVIFPYRHSKTGALLDDPDNWWLLIMGRLKPGVAESQARASLDVALQRAVDASLPNKADHDRPRLRLVTGARGLDDLRQAFGKPLFVLASLVGVILLLACANVANLLLARATARQREISVRLALGAGRWRILRQMMTEGLVLAILGGSAGLLLGYWTRNAIPNLLSRRWLPNGFHAEFDLTVLALSLALTLITGILFSLIPAWQSIRLEVNTALKGGVRTPMSPYRMIAGKSLVVLQVCLSMLLLIGAGLFIRTLSNLKSITLGFQPERILLFTIDPPRTRYTGRSRVALFEKLQGQIGAIPGVQSATISSVALVANGSLMTNATPTDKAPREGSADRVWFNDVGDHFFETMGIPILYGRALGSGDRANSPHVAVVNHQFVRKFFRSENALGKTFQSGSIYQIVGICGDARYDEVTAPVPPTFYGAFRQATDLGRMTFELRTSMSEASIMTTVREIVRSIDKDLPVFDVRTQTEQIDATLSRERLFAALTSAFGLLALILASVGVYGIMAYTVARRTGEIGIRMALGAQSGQVLLMILRETAVLSGIGVVIGVLAAMGLTRYVQSMLYGLKPSDPASLCGAIGLMLLVAFLAGWWPARRASRVDPMTALRHE